MRGSPQQVKAELLKRVADTRRELRSSESRVAVQALTLAKQASTGTYKQVVLTAMGHPYSKRNPRPPMNAAILNFQTGNLFRAWKKRGPKLTSGDMVSSVYNTSREAAFIEASYKNPAKSNQIARNVPEYVMQQIRLARLGMTRKAAKRGLKI